MTSFQQKGRHFCRPISWRASISTRSVFWNARNAEAVVEAHRDHIDVFADPIERIAKQRVTKDQERIVERFVGVTHEQVVVFETNRPIRREAIFKSDAHSAAP